MEFLTGCLDSLFREGIPLTYEIIIVDNASTDDSMFSLDRYPGTALIRNQTNVGFARANNQAMGRAKGEYLLLLNPDTIVRDGHTLKDWIRFMDQHPEVGASGCKLLYPDGSHQVGDAGFRPTLFSVLNYAFFLSRVFPSFCKGLYLANREVDREIEVDWVCGADLLVRRSILTRTGLLDESVFMYAEDVEFGCRIRSSGYRICYLPHLRIVHLQGASVNKAHAIGAVSLSWLENTRRLYRLFNKGQPVLFYDLIMTSAFLLRAMLYYAKYVFTRKEEQRRKANRMWIYYADSARHIIGI